MKKHLKYSLVLFSIFALLSAPVFAQDGAPDAAGIVKPLTPDAPCTIMGIVTSVQKLEKSAWPDGTPSPFSTTEIQAHIRVTRRQSHDPQQPSPACKPVAEMEMRTYKLCSPTPVKPADNIRATEGLSVGSTGSLTCLFDVAVLPPLQQQERQEQKPE